MPRKPRSQFRTVYDPARMKAKRLSRRNINTQRVVRGAEGWLIEENVAGRRRRSPVTWATFAEAMEAVANGYQFPPIPKHLDELPTHYVVRQATPLRVKGGRVCFWCKREGREVPAEYTVLISFSKVKKFSMSCCDTITHGLFYGSSLDDQLNTIPEED